MRIPGQADRSGIEVTAFPSAATPGSGQTLRAITDQNGRFRFEGVLPGEYNLIASRPGTSLAAVALHVQAATAVNLDLTPWGRVRGKVELAGETVHGGIHVYLAGTSYSATTDASGHYEIDNVPVSSNGYTLVAEKLGFAPYKIEGVRVQDSDQPVQATDMVLTYPTQSMLLKFADADGGQAIAGVTAADDSTGIEYQVSAFDAGKYPGVFTVAASFGSAGSYLSGSRPLRIKAPGYHDRLIDLGYGLTQVNLLKVGTRLVSISNSSGGDGKWDPQNLASDVVLTFSDELGPDAIEHVAFGVSPGAGGGYSVQSLKDFSPVQAAFGKTDGGADDRRKIVLRRPASGKWKDASTYTLYLGRLKDKNGKDVDFYETNLVTATSGYSFGAPYASPRPWATPTPAYPQTGDIYPVGQGMAFDEPLFATATFAFRSSDFDTTHPLLAWPQGAALSVAPVAFTYWDDRPYNSGGLATLGRSTFDSVDRVAQISFPPLEGAKRYSIRLRQAAGTETLGSELLPPLDTPETRGSTISVIVPLADFSSNWRPVEARITDVKVVPYDEFGRRGNPLTVQIEDSTAPRLISRAAPEWGAFGYWWSRFVPGADSYYGFPYATELGPYKYRLAFSESVAVTDWSGFKLSARDTSSNALVFQSPTHVETPSDKVAVLTYPASSSFGLPVYLKVPRLALADRSGNKGPVETGFLRNSQLYSTPSPYYSPSPGPSPEAGLDPQHDLYIQITDPTPPPSPSPTPWSSASPSPYPMPSSYPELSKGASASATVDQASPAGFKYYATAGYSYKITITTTGDVVLLHGGNPGEASSFQSMDARWGGAPGGEEVQFTASATGFYYFYVTPYYAGQTFDIVAKVEAL